jgi:signal transduction histidine kinase
MASKLLIVDDEPSAAATMEAAFASEGYDLEFADSGTLAIQKANSSMPDIILLDVMMPGMNGFEVCRRLRSNPRLAEVPIIILTALDDRASRLAGIEAGADDFLAKPIDVHELRLRVRTILKLDRYRTLVTQRESLQKMASHIITAQEEERKHISRELHDDFGQALIAHMLNLRNLQIDLSKKNNEFDQTLETLIADTNKTLEKIRLLAQDLRPTLLDTLGLKKALETYCNEFKVRSRLSISIDLDGDFPELSDMYSITLYRFLQEALTNVIKHSKASQVWVELYMEGQNAILTVQDNGLGFSGSDLEQVKGIGITGMRERMLIAGGELRINSSPAKGTIISAHLPLEKKSLESEQ